MKGSIVILCGGGPAPGINSVISSLSKVFIEDNYRVIGLHGGYRNLFSGEANTVDFTFDMADRIHNQGGSVLTMSRYKPKDEEFNSDFFTAYQAIMIY